MPNKKEGDSLSFLASKGAPESPLQESWSIIHVELNCKNLYKKDFYLETVKPFAGGGIALEGNISKWWAQQTHKVAHGEGLFCHLDEGKHGR